MTGGRRDGLAPMPCRVQPLSRRAGTPPRGAGEGSSCFAEDSPSSDFGPAARQDGIIVARHRSPS